MYCTMSNPFLEEVPTGASLNGASQSTLEKVFKALLEMGFYEVL